jgi:hypothetical protein
MTSPFSNSSKHLRRFQGIGYRFAPLAQTDGRTDFTVDRTADGVAQGDGKGDQIEE